MKSRYVLLTSAAFVTVLLVQGAHTAEHVAQVIQKFVLGYQEARGLLGSVFDFEWVHFIYNSTLEAALILILVWCRRATGHPGSPFLRAVVVLQAYHVVEHVVKMYQYYFIGVTGPTKGILGFVFPVIWVHFWMNVLVYALIFGAWYVSRRMLREQLTLAPA